MMNAIRDIGNILFSQQLIKPKEIVINVLLKCGNMIRRIPKPKFLFQKSFELVRFAIMAESFMQWRRGDATYSQLLLPFVAIISITKLMPYFHTHYIEREWDMVYDLLTDRTKEQFKKQCDVLNVIIGICYFCGVYPAILYFNKPYVVYSAYKVVVVLGLFMAFEDDRLMWRITIGNRISVYDAHQICKAIKTSRQRETDVLDIRYSRRREMDVLDIRYFLCDGLRRGFKLNTVKTLLQIYPDYINTLDRDKSSWILRMSLPLKLRGPPTHPFLIACWSSTVDIVQYIAGLDNKLLDLRQNNPMDFQGGLLGDSPLHIACRRNNPEGLKVVNCLLEKRMALVTVANKDGDLPIHVASDSLKLKYTNYSRPRSRGRYPLAEEVGHVEIVWRLLLAYPDCLNCTTPGSSGKDVDKKNR